MTAPFYRSGEIDAPAELERYAAHFFSLRQAEALPDPKGQAAPPPPPEQPEGKGGRDA